MTGSTSSRRRIRLAGGRAWPRMAAAASALLLALAMTGSGGAVTAQPFAPAQPYITAQNTWFTDADLDAYGVSNEVISIGGQWFLQEGALGITFEEFLATTQTEVEQRLDEFQAAHPEVDPNTDAIIMIDIEGPSPSGLHNYTASEQDAIVDAYQVRIAAAKASFPNAELVLWATVMPDPRGMGGPGYQARLAALIEAGQEGLFDDLDYVSPNLYVRYGCDDEVTGPCDTYWDTIDEYTQLGVTGSKQLKRSDGTGLPLLPFLTFQVINASSPFDREFLLNLGVPDPVGATLGTQIDIFEANGVQQFVLWTPRDSDVLGDPSDPTVTDYLEELFGASP